MKFSSLFLSLAVVAPCIAAAPVSQPASQPASKPTPSYLQANVNVEEGIFESKLAGIRFRPPADGVIVRQVNSGEMVRFLYPDKKWELSAKTQPVAKPLTLATSQPGTPQEVRGLMDITADALLSGDPTCKFIDRQYFNTGKYDVGVLIYRHNQGIERKLTQYVAVQKTPQSFYIFQLDAPAAKGIPMDAPITDANEKIAVATLGSVIRSVELLDLEALKEAQNNQVLRSLGWLATLNESRISDALVPEQFMMIIRDGKEVGFVHTFERIMTLNKFDGIQIALRSHVETDPVPPSVPAGQINLPALPLLPGKPQQLDRVCKYFVSFDRAREDWQQFTLIDNGVAKPFWVGEEGTSDKFFKRVLDHEALKNRSRVDVKDPKQPPVKDIAVYTLTVNKYAKVRGGLPVERKLPTEYLPQALGQILPRLLPLDTPDSYLFRSYVSETGEVMARYVDVLPEAPVTLDGKMIVAVRVMDRIGVDAKPTIHYMTAKGDWLGSVNEEQHLMVIPTDEVAVRQHWPNANMVTFDQEIPKEMQKKD